MEVSAQLRFLRVTPRKISQVADQIRGKNVNVAFNLLKVMPRQKIARIFSNLLKSAVANADHKGTVDVDTLVVREILVGKGPTLKRFLTRAKGAASPIQKRTSNIRIKLAES